ncbi:hypothetical protein [Geobacter sp. SVR]|uniref:hypothetical protein n=1 Tax=Geobacter sp. SVR TaxID=2495594 RepID=UPI00143F0298|nr:hypothetical protein [Geobacter sp. SVR]BCS55415.1 hypothetical protein GSVR_37230 [Geobacter sp. SVR]GCF83417.1 hypothetical protein GSbR_00170 [Geobacter sp. SVR]
MVPALLRKYTGWIGLLVGVMLACGCATTVRNKNDLHRLNDIGPLSKDARIGLTPFTSCGGSYLDKLNPEYHEQDAKAIFYRTCTELGYPQAFSKRLHQRLEERFGRKLVVVRSDKTFKPKQVLQHASKLGLEYVIAGDLLYMGTREGKTVVSAVFYLIQVADSNIVVMGRVNKSGPVGQSQKVIDEVADELFVTAFEG